MFAERLKAVAASFAGVLCLAGLTSTAHALLFTTTGTTSGGSVSGSADFEIDTSTNTLEITLTNTTGSIKDIAQVLDGLSFTLTGGTGLTFLGIGSVGGFIDCTSGSCVSVGTFEQYPGNPNQPAFPVPSPYGWDYVNGGLLAGSGSFKPAGIVNNGISSADGLPNREHNDYLLGPVEFEFSFTTAPVGVSDVSFWWGTGGESTPGTGTGCTTDPCVLQQAPEPGSIALMGLALSGLAWARRRRKA